MCGILILTVSIYSDWELWLVSQVCMGMCLHQNITEESKKAKLQSSKIERELCEHAKTEMNVVKLLMLGKLKHIHVCVFKLRFAVESAVWMWFLWFVCQEPQKVARAPWSNRWRSSTVMASPNQSSSVSRYWIIVSQIEHFHMSFEFSSGAVKWQCFLLPPPQPAVLDNLLTSMKFVLRGMGMLRINLANKNNKVYRNDTLYKSNLLVLPLSVRFIFHCSPSLSH